jgi:hypothetical protein
MSATLVPLVEAIIEAFLFLENSGDDQVDPDSAVRCMENMSSSLLSMSKPDQLNLRATMSELATRSEDSTYSKFVAELPNMIGPANS